MIRNRYRISSTSVSSEEKNELCSICKYFDLEYSGIFDRDCSHLIANLVSGSQK